MYVFQLRVDGYGWSSPFSVSTEGAARVCLKKDSGNDQLQLRIAVRSGAKSSSYEVIFRPNSLSSPYRSHSYILFYCTHFQIDCNSVLCLSQIVMS